jgi:hypothetical protein
LHAQLPENISAYKNYKLIITQFRHVSLSLKGGGGGGRGRGRRRRRR